MAIHGVMAQVFLHQSGAGLAAGAAFVCEVRADEDRIEGDALRVEKMQHEFVHQLEVRLGEAFAADTILVGDHHELVARGLQRLQRREHVRHEAHFVEAIDLLVTDLFDQGAIAINEEDGFGIVAHGGAHGRLASSRSFCSGLPMLMRSACAG
jgi:hypothetical protein